MRHVLLATALGALLLFQNCAPAPQEGDSSASSSGYGDELPFAYEATLDTIAYMSCSGMNGSPVDKRAYFTFRASASSSSTGGLALNSEFRSRTAYYQLKDRARALNEGKRNADTLLSLSLRQSSNLQVPWKEGELKAGEELDSFLPNLGSGVIAGPLAASNGTRRNYFPGGFSKRFMEASLRFYNFDNTAAQTRDAVDSGNALLVAGYTNSTDETDTSLRGPGSAPSATQAYGTGYRIYFDVPVTAGSGVKRVISSSAGIEEKDLLTGLNRTATWECKQEYRFVVVRPEDKLYSGVQCDTTIDQATSAQAPGLAAIRRVLRIEDWFVDMNRRCIVPKRTGDYCYGPLNGRTIQYGTANCANTSSTLCPHYVSVCIRR